MSEPRPILLRTMIDPSVSVENEIDGTDVAEIKHSAKSFLDTFNQVFSSDFNIEFESEICDDPENYRPEHVSSFRENTSEKICDKIIDNLEKSGAPKIRNWVTAWKMSEVFDHDFREAIFINALLNHDVELRKKTTQEFLPQECREHGAFKKLLSNFKKASKSDITYVLDLIKEEAENSFKEASEKDMTHLRNLLMIIEEALKCFVEAFERYITHMPDLKIAELRNNMGEVYEIDNTNVRDLMVEETKQNIKKELANDITKVQDLLREEAEKKFKEASEIDTSCGHDAVEEEGEKKL